jgi:hypothetical protein
MPGFMFMIGECINCNRQFTFAPSKVPSLRVNGVKEPLCRACFYHWNEIQRAQKGLPLMPVPDGAYEPEPEMPDGYPDDFA